MWDRIMTDAIFLPMEDIRTYCQKWGIREFAVFGSVLRADFNTESDIDVLLQFRPDVHRTLFDLATMSEELEAVLGRKVDLLTRKSVEDSPNYIRRKSILASAQVIYAE
jgi:hypothetical protein